MTGGGYRLYPDDEEEDYYTDGSPPSPIDRVSTDENDGEEPTHECMRCGYETKIVSPYPRPEHWCRGKCDGFSRFERLD